MTLAGDTFEELLKCYQCYGPGSEVPIKYLCAQIDDLKKKNEQLEQKLDDQKDVLDEHLTDHDHPET